MKAPDKEPVIVKKSFSLLHATTQEKIKEALSRQFSVLLMTTRKGLAPVTVCSDCGTMVTCPQCGAPLVLHRKKSKGGVHHEQRIYMCHHCTYTTAPIDRCATCTSWKLTLLGISTESLVDEATKLFPKSTVLVCDGDNSTPSDINKKIALWKKTPGSILIATPIIIPYLESTDFGCIVSMDSLLSLPLYTGSEQGLHTALHVLEKCTHTAIIQTRSLEHDVIVAIANENIYEFVKTETESRKMFGYPPAKILIKVSCDVAADQAPAASQSFEKLFQVWSPDILAKRAKKPGYVSLHIILKIEPLDWNNTESSLHHLLKDISHDCTIEVNPEGIL